MDRFALLILLHAIVLVILSVAAGFILGRRPLTPKRASEVLSEESKRIRVLMKPQRRYIPYGIS